MDFDFQQGCARTSSTMATNESAQVARTTHWHQALVNRKAATSPVLSPAQVDEAGFGQEEGFNDPGSLPRPILRD
jgi:hypothetical protein